MKRLIGERLRGVFALSRGSAPLARSVRRSGFRGKVGLFRPTIFIRISVSIDRCVLEGWPLRIQS